MYLVFEIGVRYVLDKCVDDICVIDMYVYCVYLIAIRLNIAGNIRIDIN